MKKCVASLLLLAGASGHGVATPVDKVISLLTKLTEQVSEEGVAEAASYDKYACFCKENAKAKVYEIAKSDKKIKELDADLQMLKGEITLLNDAVGSRKKDVAKEAKTKASNQKARGVDQRHYAEDRKGLEASVKAVESALESMRNSRDDVESKMAELLQKLPSGSPAIALIAEATSTRKYNKPGKAHAYQFGSKEVIATLHSLLQTFKKDLAELDMSEMRSASDFGKSAGARANTVTALKKEINEKETLSASKSEEKSDKDELKAQEIKARNADQKFLDDLTSKCEGKAKAWDKRSTTRAQELTALTQAVALLKGSGNAYNSNSKLVGLISKNSKPVVGKHAPAMFLQLRGAGRQAVDEQRLQQLTSHLNKEAQSLSSASLAMLALQLQAAGPDHFVKVRGIIKDLIGKLNADAKAEATSKTVCDKNMKAAVDKRDKNAAALEIAGAQIDSTRANINNLKAEMVDLSKEVAGLNKELLEASELRTGEKAQNLKTIADAGSGKAAVDQAIGLLRKFYGGALLQASAAPKKTVDDLAPKTFSSSDEYKGKSDASKGIIGMLEVIASDFDRTSKAVTASEADAVKDYNKLKSDTEKVLKDKAKLKKAMESDVETKTSELTGFKGDSKDANKMNKQALEELEKLTAACVDTGETFEQRAKHRKQEIEALKEALQLLEDWK